MRERPGEPRAEAGGAARGLGTPPRSRWGPGPLDVLAVRAGLPGPLPSPRGGGGGEPEVEGLRAEASGGQGQSSGEQGDEGTWPSRGQAAGECGPAGAPPRGHTHPEGAGEDTLCACAPEKTKCPSQTSGERNEAHAKQQQDGGQTQEQTNGPPPRARASAPVQTCTGSGPGPQLRGSPPRRGAVGVTSHDS